MKIDPHWIVGFVDGEGCFHIGLSAHAEMSAGTQVLPEFTIVQHQRDIQILQAIRKHFGCGVVRKNNGDRMAYRVRSMEHLTQVIVPFFQKHPLKTKKNTDFKKFCSVLNLMKRKAHLNTEGIEQIRKISEQMNRKAEHGISR